MTQFLDEKNQNIQPNNQRPQSPTIKLKSFFMQSFNKLTIVNPLKNLFQNVSKIRQENSSLSQIQKSNDFSNQSKQKINNSSILSIRKSSILKEQTYQVNQENSQNFDNNLSFDKQNKIQLHEQSNSSIKLKQSNNKNNFLEYFSQQSQPQLQNQLQNSISKIDQSSFNHQNSISSIVQGVDIMLNQSKNHQTQLKQEQNYNSSNVFKQRQSIQIKIKNSSIVKNNKNHAQQNFSASAFSKLTDFVVKKSPQKLKQKQNQVNNKLINKLENLNFSESSFSVNVSKQIPQSSNQNILQDSKQFKKDQNNFNMIKKQKNSLFVNNPNSLHQNSFNEFNTESKQIKKSSTKQGTSLLQQNQIKNSSKFDLNNNSSNQQAIFQKSKYQISNTVQNQDKSLFPSHDISSELQFQQNKKNHGQNYNNLQQQNQEIDQNIIIQNGKLQSQNYEQQYQRIFQSANFQLNQQSQSRKDSAYQQKIRKRVGTQMNSYDKNNKLKNQQSGKFSKVKKNIQTEDRIFNTQVNSHLGNSKVTKIIQAKQYKKKILQEELAKVSAQIQTLHKKQVQVRQCHSPNQFNDRVKINDDPLARKKAISLVKNLRVEKVQRVKAKISEFEHVDKKINDYMIQLAKIRQENQLRTKQKKKLEIIQRMKQKQMQKMKQQKKINANVQFVHQLKQEKPQTRGNQIKNLKPNSPSIKSPQSKQRRRSQWSQAQQDGATPQLANKKAYLNKIRNLSNKKSSKLDMYQNKLS